MKGVGEDSSDKIHKHHEPLPEQFRQIDTQVGRNQNPETDKTAHYDQDEAIDSIHQPTGIGRTGAEYEIREGIRPIIHRVLKRPESPMIRFTKP